MNFWSHACNAVDHKMIVLTAHDRPGFANRRHEFFLQKRERRKARLHWDRACEDGCAPYDGRAMPRCATANFGPAPKRFGSSGGSRFQESPRANGRPSPASVQRAPHGPVVVPAFGLHEQNAVRRVSPGPLRPAGGPAHKRNQGANYHCYWQSASIRRLALYYRACGS